MSLDVPAWSVFGFLGPNGAGKTTTLRILTGLAWLTSGTARVLGSDLREVTESVRAQIGFLPDAPGFYSWMTAPEFLTFAGRLFGLDRQALRERTEEGRNEDKMIAHEGGTAGKFLPTVWIKTNGVIAMRNQRYPITDVGLENLISKLIERGEIDKAAGRREHEVTFHENAKVNGRTCTLLQIKNAQPSENLDFHMAQIFIDTELNVPIRYVAYDFPPKAGDPMPVIEEYTYLNLKLNVGLTDKDFDRTNTDYNF